MAHQFRTEFVATFPNNKLGERTWHAMSNLHGVFKSFDLWSMDANVLPHIRADEKLWTIPDDARSYIFELTER